MNTTVIEAAPAVAAQQVQQPVAMRQAGGELMGAASAPASSLSVIQHALQSGATPAELRAIMELQRDMDNHQLALMKQRREWDEEDRRRNAELAFDAAMSKLRSFNIVIPKTKEVVQTSRSGGPGPRFWQSEYDVVVSMLSPAMAQCGLSFRHDMKFGQREWKADGSNPNIPVGTDILIPWVWVTCYLTHVDGFTLELTLEGPPDTSGSKNPLQEMQSTASYLKRQSLLAITGTATGGEDDEGHASRRPREGERATGRRQDAPDQQGPSESLLDEGRAAAMNGMDALTAWWAKLTPQQQKAMGNDFLQMRKAARLADQRAAAAAGNTTQGEEA